MSEGKISNKSKIILTISIGIVLLAVFAFLIDKFLINSISLKKNELEKQKLSLNYFIEEGRNLEKYKSLAEKMQQNQEAIDEAIVKRGGEIKFIEKLEEVSSSLNMEIEIEIYQPPKKNISPKVNSEGEITPEEQAKVERLQAEQKRMTQLNYFMINYIGNYSDLMNFIYRVENSGYAIILNSLDVKSLNSLDIQRLKTQTQNEKNNKYQEVEIESNILLSFMPLQ